MASFALQSNDKGHLVNTPIGEEVYQAALKLQAAAKLQPAALPAEQHTAPVVDPVVRALVDVPPFVDRDGKTLVLKAGELATVSIGIAELLVKRGKAALVTSLVLLAALLSGCAEVNPEYYGAEPDSQCDNAEAWHYEQAARQIGKNETARQWHRAMAQDYREAWMDGAICKGWLKQTPWGVA